MDASEALLRAIAFRLTLLVLAVFAARTLPDNRPAIDATVTAAAAYGSLLPDEDSTALGDMVLYD
ncbi:hypothetical protein [Agrobacterium sp. OT33]|uniref:hypothetical protein n=1 Tax=Agrobacterium sp. OT33 TaxID=2815338 RepID=UPI001A8EFD13|nr:hypothetical protein [Agrobacterium sp. OT33]MBO0125297.1 hypothetical protein [Agrobacterium sp. OT33]